jgi:NAD-dependent SIR2 family protein deacetylase
VCAVKRELSIDFAELSNLEVHCAKCGTKITIDFKRESLTPPECPCCHETFNSGYIPALRAFREAYRCATQAGTPALRFRIPFE